MDLNNFLVISAILFSIGLYGALTKKHLVVIFMCIELMFNAVLIAAVAFARFTPTIGIINSSDMVEIDVLNKALSGHVLAVLIISVAAAETALALALVFTLYRNKESVEVTDVSSMQR